MTKTCFPGHPEVPISKAVRAGSFVFTSAYGPWVFDPAKVTFDDNGRIVDDGTGNAGMPFEEQVHATFAMIRRALETAGCTLGDVVDCEVWLADPRDFVAFNRIYATYFTVDPPARSAFVAQFMFSCKLEMKVRAWTG